MHVLCIQRNVNVKNVKKDLKMARNTSELDQKHLRSTTILKNKIDQGYMTSEVCLCQSY